MTQFGRAAFALLVLIADVRTVRGPNCPELSRGASEDTRVLGTTAVQPARLGHLVQSVESPVAKARRSPPLRVTNRTLLTDGSHPPEIFARERPTGHVIIVTTTHQALHSVVLCVSSRVGSTHRCSIDAAIATVPQSFLCREAATAPFYPLSPGRKTSTAACLCRGIGPSQQQRVD